MVFDFQTNVSAPPRPSAKPKVAPVILSASQSMPTLSRYMYGLLMVNSAVCVPTHGSFALAIAVRGVGQISALVARGMPAKSWYLSGKVLAYVVCA